MMCNIVECNLIDLFSGNGGGIGAGNYYGGGSGSFSKSVSASASPQLFNDIFNVR